MNTSKDHISCNSVKEIIQQVLAQTNLSHLKDQPELLLGNGKMLRTKLAIRIAEATHPPANQLIPACAAMELVHSATLLHDDVIDHGTIRRGAPTFWTTQGIPGAILMGDILLCKALNILTDTDTSDLLPCLIRLITEIAEAEAEQELVHRESYPTPDTAISNARRKTGPLFAFACYTAHTDDSSQSDALLLSGYDIGTAYQLMDDLIDLLGSDNKAQKTLGTDTARKKATTAALHSKEDLLALINSHLQSALDRVHPWPDIEKAIRSYIHTDLKDAFQQPFHDQGEIMGHLTVMSE